MERGQTGGIPGEKRVQGTGKIMKIAALQGQSLIEYPGKISAVIFTSGCNFRCVFCYVPDLVLPERTGKTKLVSENSIFSFLKDRKNLLEAVAITGGEPTLQEDLPDFIVKIKKMGYLVELETNGTNFQMLGHLIKSKLVDYVAMDIKHDLVFEKYKKITGDVLTKELFENIKKSILILSEGKIEGEFRTTLMKEFHKEEDIVGICKKIKKAKIYYLQNFEEKNQTLSGKKFTPFSKEEILKTVKSGAKYANIQPRPYLLK